VGQTHDPRSTALEAIVKEYLDLVREVLAKGTRKVNRTGVDTLSTFNINYEIDLREGFPS
jgi:thymidylate synthase